MPSVANCRQKHKNEFYAASLTYKWVKLEKYDNYRPVTLLEHCRQSRWMRNACSGMSRPCRDTLWNRECCLVELMITRDEPSRLGKYQRNSTIDVTLWMTYLFAGSYISAMLYTCRAIPSLCFSTLNDKQLISSNLCRRHEMGPEVNILNFLMTIIILIIIRRK